MITKSQDFPDSSHFIISIKSLILTLNQNHWNEKFILPFRCRINFDPSNCI